LKPVEHVSRSMEDLTIGGGKVRIQTKEAQPAFHGMINLLEKERVRVRHIKSDEPTLEDVFLHLA